MYDPELLVELLREMASAEGGQKLEPPAFGADQAHRHNLDLLADAGQAEWNDSKSIIRITKDGHDFLNQIDKNLNSMKKLIEYHKKGISYALAVKKFIEFIPMINE